MKPTLGELFVKTEIPENRKTEREKHSGNGDQTLQAERKLGRNEKEKQENNL